VVLALATVALAVMVKVVQCAPNVALEAWVL